jgi:hypothetical protein
MINHAHLLTNLVMSSHYFVRDGTGLVGPLVIPGVTSCLVNH